MLKKCLIASTLLVCSMFALHAAEVSLDEEANESDNETSTLFHRWQKQKRDNSPQPYCCLNNEEDQEELASSSLFAVFNEDEGEDEGEGDLLLACNNCK